MPDSTNGSDHGKGELSPQERAAFKQRVDELDAKLDRVTGARDSESRSDDAARMRGRGMAYGLRMASELVAAVLVGGLIGYGLDYLAGTKPWLFLLFFILGFAAGVMNLVRGYNKMQADLTATTGGDLGHRLDERDDD